MECIRDDFEKERINGPETKPVNSPGDASAEPDLPPEFCHYRDEGCALAEACLDCPFPECVYDHPRGRSRTARSLRDAAIVQMHFVEKIPVKIVAARFHITERTAYRILGDIHQRRTQ